MRHKCENPFCGHQSENPKPHSRFVDKYVCEQCGCDMLPFGKDSEKDYPDSLGGVDLPVNTNLKIGEDSEGPFGLYDTVAEHREQSAQAPLGTDCRGVPDIEKRKQSIVDCIVRLVLDHFDVPENLRFLVSVPLHRALEDVLIGPTTHHKGPNNLEFLVRDALAAEAVDLRQELGLPADVYPRYTHPPGSRYSDMLATFRAKLNDQRRTQAENAAQREMDAVVNAVGYAVDFLRQDVKERKRKHAERVNVESLTERVVNKMDIPKYPE